MITTKRIEALRLIWNTSGGIQCRRVGAGRGYCIALQKAGLVSIRGDFVTLTEAGKHALVNANLDAEIKLLGEKDAAEVKRFHAYLTDKANLPSDQFAENWAAYENGTK